MISRSTWNIFYLFFICVFIILHIFIYFLCYKKVDRKSYILEQIRLFPLVYGWVLYTDTLSAGFWYNYLKILFFIFLFWRLLFPKQTSQCITFLFPASDHGSLHCFSLSDLITYFISNQNSSHCLTSKNVLRSFNQLERIALFQPIRTFYRGSSDQNSLSCFSESELFVEDNPIRTRWTVSINQNTSRSSSQSEHIELFQWIRTL